MLVLVGIVGPAGCKAVLCCGSERTSLPELYVRYGLYMPLHVLFYALFFNFLIKSIANLEDDL